MGVDKAITYLKKKAPKGEFLAYINKKEAAMLKKAGGSGELVNGIPSFRPQDMGNKANQARSAANTGIGGGKRSNNNNNNNNNYTGPSQYGVSTRTVNRITAPPATTRIGGKKYDVTPETKGARNRAELKQQLLNQTKLGGNRIDKFGNTKKSLFRQGGSGIGSLLASIFGLAMGIPGLGLLTGGLGSLKNKFGDTFSNFNETMRGINPVTGKANTQAEYEAMVADRRTQSRIDKMQERINRGYNQIGIGNFTKQTGPITDNQRATLAGLLGQKDRFGNQFGPSTAQNVLTGRDLKGFTESRGLQTPTYQTGSVPFDPSLGNRFNSGSVPFDPSLGNRFTETNQPRKGIMQTIGDAFFSPAAAADFNIEEMLNNERISKGVAVDPLTAGATLNAGAVPDLSNPNVLNNIATSTGMPMEGVFTKTPTTQTTRDIKNIQDYKRNPDLQFNVNDIMELGIGQRLGQPQIQSIYDMVQAPGQTPFLAADGGLASMFTRRG